jgi:single-strand DNA-binding protein
MFNECNFGGNITANPEIRQIPNSDAVVCSFTIAVNNRVKNRQTGEYEDDPCYIDCEAWGQTATTIHEKFKKGNPIYVSGSMKQEKWADKETGKNRSRYRLRLNRFYYPMLKKADATSKDDNGEQGGAPASSSVGEDLPF